MYCELLAQCVCYVYVCFWGGGGEWRGENQTCMSVSTGLLRTSLKQTQTVCQQE